MAAVAVHYTLRGIAVAALVNSVVSQEFSTSEDLTATSCNGQTCASSTTRMNKETVLLQRGVIKRGGKNATAVLQTTSKGDEDLEAALQTCSKFVKQSEIDECTAHFQTLFAKGEQGELKYEAEVLTAYFTGSSASEMQIALLQRARSVRGNQSATLNSALRIKGPGEICAVGGRGQDAVTWPCDGHSKCFDPHMGSEHVFAQCVSAEMECRTKAGEASGKCRELCYNVERRSRICSYDCNCPMPSGGAVRPFVPGNREGAMCTTIYARRGSMQNCWDFQDQHDCADSRTDITCLPREEGGHCQGCRSGWPFDNAGYAASVYPCWPAKRSMGTGLFKCRGYRQEYEDAGW